MTGPRVLLVAGGSFAKVTTSSGVVNGSMTTDFIRRAAQLTIMGVAILLITVEYPRCSSRIGVPPSLWVEGQHGGRLRNALAGSFSHLFSS